MAGLRRRFFIFSTSSWMGVCISIFSKQTNMLSIVILSCYVDWGFFVFFYMAVRCLLFVFRRNVESIHPPVWGCSTFTSLSLSLIYNLIGLQWLLIGKLDNFCYSRFSNISSWISQVWHSSPHMRFWFCSGQRFTTRLSFTGSSVYQFYVWFKSVMTWHILNRHVRYLLMDSGQVSLQLMRWFIPFRWIFFPYFCY
jgi:hypothetical protein